MERDTHPRHDDAPQAERPVKPAIWRGWRLRCPSCGKGRLLTGYLTVRPACPACKEDFRPQRADDGPAYLTILIVGHIMAPLLVIVFVEFRPSPGVLAGVFSLGTVALSLYLLPRLKGVLVAIQWARRMHGFGGPDPAGKATPGAPDPTKPRIEA
ncbi:zinc-finger protein [Defluviimonas sp. 20V17]|uniref:Uncharacterized conserved protein, DUF983 family n=1 Tax=Allgaiera indica TaxID=765699 RepID=A0AAN5A0T6_9RHOB|nr:DUF983 domain-containing protein [Allgaiera indica]KDB05325.1 zinc-finger protein [Defluviimonas sp. 20V17]GHE04854.1 zinc-finger protein [Allgaiera indica]SDX52429.1 Uncharacterized conserved protein, DUF983 family [Allgaiera indica]